jgi:tetrahydromethanopterin S-methyltransferase subunit G
MDNDRLDRVEQKLDEIHQQLFDLSGKVIRLETIDQMNENLRQTRKHTMMQWIAIGMTMSVVILDLVKVWLL